ncbi:MAG: extracellular solute-binding protein [Butyrivibrio sp.]|nr:extracellular solute-binding protein [Butyrivibrio sp.]
MRKKILAVALVAAMAAMTVVGCGSSSSSSSSSASGDKETSAAGGSNEGEETSAANIDYGEGTLKIWVPDKTVDLTKEQVEKFADAHPDMMGKYEVVVEPVGEGEAAKNMLADVEAGADLFAFAQDQLARLIGADAITQIQGDYADFVATANDAGAAGAAKVGDKTYAFPLTSDNGYFLYYDKSVITDPSTMEKIIEDCEAAGKSVYFALNDGWYQPAYFFGAGCTLTYEADEDGQFIGSDINYASENGVAAMKGLINLASSKAFVCGADAAKATNAAAIVTGTWSAKTVQEMFGENYAATKLPTFNVDGKDYQLGGFGGFKLLGVKPQANPGKLIVCLELAKFLSGEEVQLARFEAVEWGPSNLNAQANEAVQSNPALAALAAQLAFTIPQGQYPDQYWQDAIALGDDIISNVSTYAGYSDDDLMKILKDFQEKEQALANAE